MKIYEDLTRIKVAETLQSGLAAQKHRRLPDTNGAHPVLSPEERQDLLRRLFQEEDSPDNHVKPGRPALSRLVVISIGMLLATTALRWLFSP